MIKKFLLISLFLVTSALLIGSTSNGRNLPLGEVTRTVVDVTDGTDATYYYYVPMDSYKNIGIQMILDGGTADITATIEASTQNDGTTQASLDYIDITEAVFGTASYTDDCMLLDDTGALSLTSVVRIKIVAASTADDADWTIYLKKKQ
ncbi:MAG: hypothetical protein KAH23_04465 [Kiritimatiellae bacterium]|nr:hypothetical protein [Kiritimatiellia bacterium]